MKASTGLRWSSRSSLTPAVLGGSHAAGPVTLCPIGGCRNDPSACPARCVALSVSRRACLDDGPDRGPGGRPDHLSGTGDVGIRPGVLLRGTPQSVHPARRRGRAHLQLRLGTALAIAFARTPMTLANAGWDLQTVTGGRFELGLGSQIRPHIEQRFSMPWSRPAARMRELVQGIRAIWDTWQHGTPLDFRRRVLHPHPHGAGLRPGTEPPWRAPHPVGGRRPGHDRRRR